MALWNNTDSPASKPKFLAAGQVIMINVAGGTGYTNGAAQAMTLSAPAAGGVQATATATVVGGVITAVHITNQGSGYVTAPTVTGAPAGGTGAVFTCIIQPIGKTTVGSVTAPATILFLDSTEAQVAANRAKGLKLPGWTRYQEYVDNQGNTRYKVENIIAMSRTAAQAGDTATDDALAGDGAFTITSNPPSTANSAAGAVAGLTVVSAGSTFQWQVRQPAGGQYQNATGTIAGVTYTNGTTATLTVAGFAAPNTGTKYRCQVFNAAAGAGATSTATTVTFVS